MALQAVHSENLELAAPAGHFQPSLHPMQQTRDRGQLEGFPSIYSRVSAPPPLHPLTPSPPYPTVTHAPALPLTYLRLFNSFHCHRNKYDFPPVTYRVLSLQCLPPLPESFALFLFYPPWLLPDEIGEPSQACWCTPTVSATGEAEAEGLPERKSSRPAWVDYRDTCLKNKERARAGKITQ